MDIIFSIIGLLFLLALLLGFVFLILFIARKAGIIKVSENGEGEGVSTVTGYIRDLKVANHSLLFRFIVIAVLIGLMTIPVNMVELIVGERSSLYRSVVHQIASTWGREQKLQGPALLIPFTEKYVSEVLKTDKDGNERKVKKVSYLQRTAIVLPDDLDITVDIKGQKRKRSLYESLVYTADVALTGAFTRPDIGNLSSHIETIHWDQAWLALGISDTQAINKVSDLFWDSQNVANLTANSDQEKFSFEPGTRITRLFRSGFHAPMSLGESETVSKEQMQKDATKLARYNFKLAININGSQGFYFSPFGKTTRVNIRSDWPHPSFKGNVLPDEHEIDQTGFAAIWSVPHLARNYPQRWVLENQSFNVNEFVAGVDLFESVSLYSQITRAIKYSVLFFTLTYITFLIFELGIGRRLHIVQYAIIGLALSMFYLTLLSMAEHAGFFKAYISAALIIITMISLYAFAAIRRITPTAVIALLLTGLYSMLYSLLKLEDYALLAGTALLLLILAILMFLTRNIGKKELVESS